MSEELSEDPSPFANKYWNKEWNPYSDDKFWGDESSDDSEDIFLDSDEDNQANFSGSSGSTKNGSNKIQPIGLEVIAPQLPLTPNLLGSDKNGEKQLVGVTNNWNVHETGLTSKHLQGGEVEEVILIPDDEEDREIDAHENSDGAKTLLNEIIGDNTELVHPEKNIKGNPRKSNESLSSYILCDTCNTTFMSKNSKTRKRCLECLVDKTGHADCTDKNCSMCQHLALERLASTETSRDLCLSYNPITLESEGNVDFSFEEQRYHFVNCKMILNQSKPLSYLCGGDQRCFYYNQNNTREPKCMAYSGKA